MYVLSFGTLRWTWLYSHLDHVFWGILEGLLQPQTRWAELEPGQCDYHLSNALPLWTGLIGTLLAHYS